MSDQNIIVSIGAYLDAHMDEMLDDLSMLIRIPSVYSEPVPGCPYGEAAHEALLAAQSLMEKYGFATYIYGDRVVSGDMNTLPRSLDILAHLDVVPPGEGWSVTEPFTPLISDGRIYGRGTSDDKGPAIAALYAMRAVKELGIPLDKNCRLVCGTDEERGGSDLPFYLEEEGEAPMTFTPDAYFPVINIEKGRLVGEISLSLPESPSSSRRILSMKSGDTINIVPGRAEASVRGISPEEAENAAKKLRLEIPDDFGFALVEAEGALSLSVSGHGAHASTPEQGVNAAVIMLHILSHLFPEDAALSALTALLPYADHCGSAMGFDVNDDISGHTTLSPDIVRIDSTKLLVKFDSRTSIAFEQSGAPDTTAELIRAAGFGYTAEFSPAHAVDEASFFVKTLLRAYSEVTGLPGRSVAIGGGTYVHSFKRGVAFGAVGENTDTHMHGADEYMDIAELRTAALVYALSIAGLIGGN